MAKKKKVPGIFFQASESRRPFGLLMTEEDIKRQVDKWCEDDHGKLLMLCRHYGIEEEPYMFYSLALALARELYPELNKSGRKSKWTAPNKGALVVEIERLIKPGDKTHGVSWAAKQLAKLEPWKSFVEAKESEDTSEDPAEVLRTTYQRFKENLWARMFRNAFKMYEHEKKISEWESFVIDVVKKPH